MASGRRTDGFDGDDAGHRGQTGPAFGARGVAQRRGPAGVRLLHELREPQGAGTGRETRRRRWSFIGRTRSGRSASPGRSASCRRRSRMRISRRGPEGAALRPGPRSKARSFATGRPSKRGGSSWKPNTRARKSPGRLSGAGTCCPRRAWSSGRGGPTGSTIVSATPGSRIRPG